jgi:hypothetical protein
MRRPRLALACAAVGIVGLVGPALASPAAGNTRSAGPVVPPSAGHLIQGPRDIFRPVGYAVHEHRKANAGDQQLSFGGGLRGVGVQHHPAVYLVFWGSQWRQSDPYADYEQRFFRGLYGPGDNWTGVQREWCDGVAKQAVSCPEAAARVSTPSGALVKGVWFDNSMLALPTDNPVVSGLPDAVAEEAVRAAAHFGNTTAEKNRDVQYIINEPSRFDSVGFGLYCGYHSYVAGAYGPVAYTDLPYVTDLGFDCGQNFVNSGTAGTYDGLSLVAGHEFIETLTDPYPNTGWVDHDGSENADKCAWKTSGAGAMTDVHLSTGTFAVQGSWSNLANNGNGACRNHVGG